jgi:L-iditol 2-dehydrogenase
MWLGTNDEGTLPFIPGHEWMGEVVEAGPEAKELKVGDRVVGECFLTCHACTECKDGVAPGFCRNVKIYGFSWDAPGGFCEYRATKPERLNKVPDNISDVDAACLEPVSVAYHGIWGNKGSVGPFSDVIVFGAGPIGLYGILGCKASGAYVISVEPEPYRRNLATTVGADVVIDPTQGDLIPKLLDLTEGRGADLVLECSGSDSALNATINCVKKQGRISLVGQSVGRDVPIEIGRTIWRGATIVGSFDSPYFFPVTLRFMSRANKYGLVNFSQVVTHTFPLDNILDAFKLGKQPPLQYAKMVLTI